MTKHEEAMTWLNIKFCLTQNKSEEELIKYIQEMLCQHQELRNCDA